MNPLLALLVVDISRYYIRSASPRRSDLEAAAQTLNTEAFDELAPKWIYREWKAKAKVNQKLSCDSGTYLVWYVLWLLVPYTLTPPAVYFV